MLPSLPGYLAVESLAQLTFTAVPLLASGACAPASLADDATAADASDGLSSGSLLCDCEAGWGADTAACRRCSGHFCFSSCNAVVKLTWYQLQKLFMHWLKVTHRQLQLQL